MAAVAVVVGCTAQDGQPSVEASLVTPAPAEQVTQPQMVSTPLPAEPAPPVDLVGSFDVLAAGLPAGEVGIAVSGAQQVSFGQWTSGAAWSTIKVPLSIAAMRQDPDAARPFVEQAITQSDNAAADQLWAMLGEPTVAANAVQGVLADGGDAGVVVQSQQVRPPYSAYGQTDWPQQQAAQFASALPCVVAADEVLAQMRNISGGQQWGLAGSEGVAGKGGWGPEADGGYLVRQIALVTNDQGTFGVSLAAKPADGSFATGTAVLDQLAAWVLEHRQEFGAKAC